MIKIHLALSWHSRDGSSGVQNDVAWCNFNKHCDMCSYRFECWTSNSGFNINRVVASWTEANQFIRNFRNFCNKSCHQHFS